MTEKIGDMGSNINFSRLDFILVKYPKHKILGMKLIASNFINLKNCKYTGRYTYNLSRPFDIPLMKNFNIE